MTKAELDEPDLAAFEARWRHRPAEPLTDRFGHVRPHPDHGQLARQTVAHLRALLVSPGSDHAELLGPFLDGVAELVEQTWPVEPSDQASADEGDEHPDEDEIDDDRRSPADAAAALVTEVEQLEDLLEALRAVRRRQNV